MRKNKSPFLIVLFSLIISMLNAQQLPPSITGKIDSLFSEFNIPNTPGCAIGVIRNDSLIYSKGYGLANLNKEYLISPQTMFYLASVSKQFTAYSIVLLAKAGKLKLEDDIRRHLPWFPDLKRKITIRHLLNHTSGIRDDIEMAEFGGLGNGKGVSQELAIRYIKNSRDLNFEPGYKYLYSNSNYVLLAEIVKERSGQSFKTFTDTAIFKRLEMKNSYFIDRSSELPKERAISYIMNGKHYQQASHSVFTMGDGGMFSNIEDLSKWVMNFYNTKVGDANDIAQLTQNGIRNNGNKIDYALGIVVNEHNGFRQFTHSEGLAGYRTNIAVFPDLKMGFIILSNNGAINVVTKTAQLADIFLKHYPLPGVTNKLATTKVKDKTALDLTTVKAMAGSYISEDGLPFRFSFNGQNLYWETRTVGSKRLVQTAKATFEEPSLQTKFFLNQMGKTQAFNNTCQAMTG